MRPLWLHLSQQRDPLARQIPRGSETKASVALIAVHYGLRCGFAVPSPNRRVCNASVRHYCQLFGTTYAMQ